MLILLSFLVATTSTRRISSSHDQKDHSVQQGANLCESSSTAFEICNQPSFLAETATQTGNDGGAPTTAFIRKIVGERVLLKSIYGTYLSSSGVAANAQMRLASSGAMYEEFTVSQHSSTSLFFKNLKSGKYFNAQQLNGEVREATGQGTWERWDIYPTGEFGRYFIKNLELNEYLIADNTNQRATSSNLSPPANAQWEIIQHSDDKTIDEFNQLTVAFLSLFGTYMSAPVLFAASYFQSETLEPESKFQIVKNHDDLNTYSIKSSHLSYLRFSAPGDFQLINSSPGIGTFEKVHFVFELGKFAIRSMEHSNFAGASQNDNGSVDLSKIDTYADISDNELWTIIPTNTPTFVDITYSTTSLNLIPLPPLVLAEMILDNTGPMSSMVDQEMQFSFSKLTSETSSYEHTRGYSWSVTVMAQFATMVAGISVTAEHSNEQTYGRSNTQETSWSGTNILRVPQGKKFKATATISRSTISVPYSGVVHFNDTLITKTVEGIFHGVGFFGLTERITDITP